MSESKKTWTIDEKVLFHRHHGWPDEPVPPAPNTVRCIVKGTANNGRRFYCETWVTEAFLADQGEAQVAEMLRQDAAPPEEFHS